MPVSTAAPLLDRVRTALGGVIDPEIRRPITELGMVAACEENAPGAVRVEVLLTVSGCPMRDTLRRDVTAAVSAVEGVESVQVDLGVMNDQQRAQLRDHLKGGQAEREIVFARPDSLTTVIAVASGKGGVGKSSVTVNLAMALTRLGRTVGVLDADIYGHSIPAMLGVADARPTAVEDMIMPVPTNGLKAISIGMLKPSRDQVVAWRGPILDRALTQMLADVYWGDLDFLLLDLPPGTGDVAISLGQKLPNAEVIVVTTPQQAAAEVAERAGTMASMMNQRVIGVIENMAYLETVCPHCHESHRVEVFGSGGGQEVAAKLTTRLGYQVPVLGQVPLDPTLRVAGDEGVPVTAGDPDSPSGLALTAIAEQLAKRGRGLAGRQLGVSPTGR
ncbi:putative Mrp family protein [Microlunatus phosphovorus NM-1]|uniref:Iron-sulfur cluster carrier protein n=1 Tax=Microlunatus phosphovorus (strain ATCC 700054 / DSM 10555 / JCM 9379 / NBRC 101784 / NCIMB 13414 / VKM Ac-1990 / NM-1) TaxID=1032480 RepID=F5XSP8_MICPN|nr:P-loop NTPase [Microlunatus phosphovorus]BAK37306.1 putative Mrp family protein [Microlunatus phosphovorus NM-1]